MEAGGDELTLESQEVYEGDLLGQDYFPARRLAAALPRRQLEPLGGMVPGARRGGLRGEALEPNERLADRQARPRSLPAGRRRDPRSDPERRCARSRRRRWLVRSSSTSSSAGARRPTFARSTRPELEASDRITLVLNANLVDLRLDTDLRRIDRRGVSRLRRRRPGVHAAGASLRAVLRRHREPAAFAQLRQPGAGRPRQRRRAGGAVFLRASAFRAGRGDLSRRRCRSCRSSGRRTSSSPRTRS